MTPLFFRWILSFLIVLMVPFVGIRDSHALSPPTAPASPTDNNANSGGSEAVDSNSTEEGKFDETFGRFGLTLGFQFVFSQSPQPENFYANSLGGIAELSYGIRTGVRVLVGGGYALDSPHISPPLRSSGNGPSSDFTEGYVGGRIAMNPFFPTFFERQPWIPYIRGDAGGVSAGVSNAGPANGRMSGFMTDVGLGIEGRAPEFPVGFFAEVRSQWFFLGAQTMTVMPVIVGSTFYF
ncbi:MAG: hypothetical protein ACYC9S_03145 [Leptospirales bacterium]